jgi:N-acetylmuramic acid 6-phosphate (MurNAc-6-P) etherase
VRTAEAIRDRVQAGGRLILFGNGGSATDANDFALDCAVPLKGARPIPAISLALEPAILSAIANDVGTEVIFLRQLIAHARPEDVAIGISTSGGSANVIAALEEARKCVLKVRGVVQGVGFRPFVFRLAASSLEAWTNREVPANDGGHQPRSGGSRAQHRVKAATIAPC